MPSPQEGRLESLGSRLNDVEHQVRHLMENHAEIVESRATILGVSDRIAVVETAFLEFGSHFMKYQENLASSLVKHFSESKQTAEQTQHPQQMLQASMDDPAQAVMSKAVEQIMGEIHLDLEVMRKAFTLSKPPASTTSSPANDVTSKSDLDTTASTVCVSEDFEAHAELKSLMDEARRDIDVLYGDLRMHQLATQKRLVELETSMKAQKKQDKDRQDGQDPVPSENSLPTFMSSLLKGPADTALRSPLCQKSPRVVSTEFDTAAACQRVLSPPRANDRAPLAMTSPRFAGSNSQAAPVPAQMERSRSPERMMERGRVHAAPRMISTPSTAAPPHVRHSLQQRAAHTKYPLGKSISIPVKAGSPQVMSRLPSSPRIDQQLLAQMHSESSLLSPQPSPPSRTADEPLPFEGQKKYVLL